MGNMLMAMAALLGQCSEGRCTAQSYSVPGIRLFSQPAISNPVIVDRTEIRWQPAPKKEWGWYSVEYRGLNFLVWGYPNQDGTIHWRPSLPENRKSYQDAANATNSASQNPFGDTPASNGVDSSKIGRRPGFHTVSDAGKRFVDAVRERTAVDDYRLYVTVIGNESKREQVIQDIKTDHAFDDIRQRLTVQGFAQTDWQVAPSLGFQPGNPAIYVQTCKSTEDPSGGGVIWRAKDYSVGPEGLAEAIRKADPKYNPDNDPGPNSTPVHKPGAWGDQWTIAIGSGIVLLLILGIPARKDV